MINASIILVFSAYFQTAGAYLSGAPTSICTSMSPAGTGMTGASAQSTPSPYVLNVSLGIMNAGDTLVGISQFI